MSAPAGAPIATVADAVISAQAGTLVGRRCAACGWTSFTDPLVCRACHATSFEPFASQGSGQIVSFTIIGVPAGPFAGKEPYAFVIARMAEGANAAGWVPGARDPRALVPGTKVHVVPSMPGFGLTFEIR
jgi:uncharacterized OB-fold protein